MLIGLISDTHDRLPMIDRAIEMFQRRGVQALLHPGDLIAPFAAKRLLQFKGPIYVIYGNNDGERQGLKEILPQIVEVPEGLSRGARDRHRITSPLIPHLLPPRVNSR